MLGNPIFKVEDKVRFVLGRTAKRGVVYIVDAYGTFRRDDIVCYDIFVEDENAIYKHIPEDCVRFDCD